ncbi:MAG: enoyl-CoA hydratase/isomerase family protein [Hyphomonadaceae bacterium]|nr:enoyl-CoA hydratase/isomerase family protein [Hyphomonadaceae bacterium]
MSGDVLTYSVDDGVASIVIDSPPVNALSHRVRTAIHAGMSRAMADDAVKAIVIACAGRTFFAGADVTELSRPIEPPLLSDIMALVESAAKPVIAALHGAALGGGFELALACHYRVAVSAAKVGLPEVALGLCPGAGGTQRLPRLIGVAAAVEAIALGKTIGAQEALKLGLIDELVDSDDPAPSAVTFAHSLIAREASLRRVRDLPLDVDVRVAHEIFSAFRAAHPNLFVGLKAADGVLRAIEAAVGLPFDEGILAERAISRELAATPESAAQRHLFFAERAAAKPPGGEKVKPSGRSLRLEGRKEDVDDWAKLLGSKQVGGDIVVNVSGEKARIALKRTSDLIEIAFESGADAQDLADVMAAVRRVNPAAVFVRSGEGLIVERLTKCAQVTAETLIRAGARREVLASIAPGLLGAAQPTNVDEALAHDLLDPVAAEAACLLHEGVAQRASDIDFAMVRAGRWPPWLGGPLFWAEREGVAKIDAQL